MADAPLAVGGTYSRPDGAAKVNGEAIYVDDIQLEGMWFGATVRHPVAHGKINKIDTLKAQALVPQAIFITSRDLPGPNVVRLIDDDQPILAANETRHPYEPIALVAAPTRELARAAAEAVELDITPLPAITSIDQMVESSYEGSGLKRILSEITIAEGDLLAGFKDADIIIEGTYEVGHQEQMYIEPQGMIARWTGPEQVELMGSMQCPFYIHDSLSYALGIDPSGIRVIQATTGGGFGGKEEFPNVLGAHAALLAKATGRPVKMIYDRTEDIRGTTKRHPGRFHHRTGVKKDGTLVAIEVECVFDGGAYLTLSSVVNSRGLLHAAGAYRCANVRLHGLMLSSHTAPNGAFRGFGAPQSLYAAERHMDKIARVLGMDPVSIRRKNAYRLGDVTPTGQVLSESVSALECLEQAVAATNFETRWAELEAARQERSLDDAAIASGAPMEGIGLALYWHGAGFTGNGENVLGSKAAIELTSTGKVRILSGSTDIGQGTSAVFPQMVAEGLGIRPEMVEMAPPDTDNVPDSGPTVASRTVMIVGGILARAGARAKRMMEAFVAERAKVDIDDIALTAGLFEIKGKDPLPFEDAAKAYLDEIGPFRIDEGYQSEGRFFDEKTYRGDAYPCYAWGCDVVELRVDPDTLIPTIDTVTVVCDVGKAINPTLCTGQLEGGTLQAIGYGYLEEMKVKEGRYLNERMTNYLIPTTKDSPKIDVILVENPYSGGPFGAKGVGELPMDGGAPALVAALENATGIVTNTLPATPERLLGDLIKGNTLEGTPRPSLEGITL